MKIVTWNVRGLGQQPKRNAVKGLVLKHSPIVLALIETKQPEPTLQLIHQIWGKRHTQWVSLPANGASGGIWVVWISMDHSLISSHIGVFSVTILLSSVPDGIPWKFKAIYGPNSASLKHSWWSELDYVAALLQPISCLGGDFNVTRWSYERNSLTPISQDMRDFADFISRNELIDILLQGNHFTWSNHALPSQNLIASWSHALVLPKPISDHCPIFLDTNIVRRGSKPFRFELAWLEEASLTTMIPTWWDSLSSHVRGRAGYILQTKIQLLKASIKIGAKLYLETILKSNPTSWIPSKD
ncbi:hypothetical protein AMTRI_Chr03g142470 [Amborella trichopoda]